jgi:hypothetical protein
MISSIDADFQLLTSCMRGLQTVMLECKAVADASTVAQLANIIHSVLCLRDDAPSSSTMTMLAMQQQQQPSTRSRYVPPHKRSASQERSFDAMKISDSEISDQDQNSGSKEYAFSHVLMPG